MAFDRSGAHGRADFKQEAYEMLSALYARAVYSRTRDHRFYDSKALEVVARNPIVFEPVASVCRPLTEREVARIVAFDRLVNAFVAKNPRATVVNLSCRLGTRSYRTGSGIMRWYDVDAPRVVTLRHRLLPDGPHIRAVPRPVLDPTWPSLVDGSLLGTQLSPVGGSVGVAEPIGEALIVMEDLTMHLGEKEVAALFSIIDSGFAHATLLVEVAPTPTNAGMQVAQGAHGAGDAGGWGCSGGAEMSRTVAWQFSHVRDVSLGPASGSRRGRFSLRALIPGARPASKIAILRK